jgi:tetratricopeptide (TPR) repeat protein
MQRPFILVALALALVVRAPAAMAAPSQEELARSHYVAGEEEYARGRWQEALHEFQLGYALSPRPEFLINFAQAYRKLGDYDAAERECQRYLATAPPSDLAQQAERLLRQIREERASAPPKPAAPPASAQIVQPQTNIVQLQNPNVQTHNENVQVQDGNVRAHNEPPPRRRWVVPVAIVGGVLVVGAAVTLGLVFGLDKRDTFAHAPLGTVDFR